MGCARVGPLIRDCSLPGALAAREGLYAPAILSAAPTHRMTARPDTHRSCSLQQASTASHGASPLHPVWPMPQYLPYRCPEEPQFRSWHVVAHAVAACVFTGEGGM